MAKQYEKPISWPVWVKDALKLVIISKIDFGHYQVVKYSELERQTVFNDFDNLVIGANSKKRQNNFGVISIAMSILVSSDCSNRFSIASTSLYLESVLQTAMVHCKYQPELLHICCK